MRIAIDSGGTFTDCVWLEDGRLRVVKLFSTPQRPGEAVLDAVLRVAPGWDLNTARMCSTRRLIR